jgi:hypothetical protein
MELNTFSESSSCSATQCIPFTLWNKKVQYRVHKSPTMVYIFSQMNPIHTPNPISLRSILTLPTHLRLSLPIGLFPSGFPTKTLHALLSYACYIPCSSHPPSLDHSKNKIMWALLGTSPTADYLIILSEKRLFAPAREDFGNCFNLSTSLNTTRLITLHLKIRCTGNLC